VMCVEAILGARNYTRSSDTAGERSAGRDPSTIETSVETPRIRTGMVPERGKAGTHRMGRCGITGGITALSSRVASKRKCRYILAGGT
jgi:hypothetical protein